jgi:hypothetical protein
MSEGLAITLTIIVTTIVGIGIFTMSYARCRDCRAKIYKHSIHKCPVSGKRYRGM